MRIIRIELRELKGYARVHYLDGSVTIVSIKEARSLAKQHNVGITEE